MGPAQAVSCAANGGFFMKIYTVGGAVRDRLLGLKVTDIDRVVVYVEITVALSLIHI